MKKRLLIGLLLAIVLPCCAQEWTAQDSLRLSRWLEQEGEVKLAPLPELDTSVGSPMMDADKPWLYFDATLPQLNQEQKPKVRLTLRPYSATTRYDYDPVYQRKIKVNENTWRSDPMAEFKCKLGARVAKEPVVKPSGLDLMTLFTRDFWRFRARKAGERTLQVLKDY